MSMVHLNENISPYSICLFDQQNKNITYKTKKILKIQEKCFWVIVVVVLSHSMSFFFIFYKDPIDHNNVNKLKLFYLEQKKTILLLLLIHLTCVAIFCGSNVFNFLFIFTMATFVADPCVFLFAHRLFVCLFVSCIRYNK